MATELIQSDPSIMMGKPVVAGTRIPVELILEKLAAGETIDQLIEAHPRLSKGGILAALSASFRGEGSGFVLVRSRTARGGRLNIRTVSRAAQLSRGEKNVLTK